MPKLSSSRALSIPFPEAWKQVSGIGKRMQAIRLASLYNEKLARKINAVFTAYAKEDILFQKLTIAKEKGELSESALDREALAMAHRENELSYRLKRIRSACNAWVRDRRRAGIIFKRIGVTRKIDSATVALFQKSYGEMVKRREAIPVSMEVAKRNKAGKFADAVENAKVNLQRFAPRVHSETGKVEERNIVTLPEGRNDMAAMQCAREARAYLDLPESKRKKKLTKQAIENLDRYGSVLSEHERGISGISRAHKQTLDKLAHNETLLHEELAKGNVPETATKTVEGIEVKTFYGIVHNLVKKLDARYEKDRSLVKDKMSGRFILSWTGNEVLSMVYLKLWEYVSEHGTCPTQAQVIAWAMNAFRNFWQQEKKDRTRFVSYSDGDIEVSASPCGEGELFVPDNSDGLLSEHEQYIYGRE